MLGWANHIEHTRSTQRWYDSKHRPPCQYRRALIQTARASRRYGKEKALLRGRLRSGWANHFEPTRGTRPIA